MLTKYDIPCGCLLFIRTALVFVAALVIYLSLAGCRTQQPIESSTTREQTTHTERYDTAMTVAGDSAAASLLLRCDSLGNVYIAELEQERGKRLSLEMKLQTIFGTQDVPTLHSESGHKEQQSNGTLLTIDCREDSFEMVIRGLYERIAIMESTDNTQTVEVKVVPPFYRFTMWFFCIVAVVAVLFIATKILRHIYFH